MPRWRPRSPPSIFGMFFMVVSLCVAGFGARRRPEDGPVREDEHVSSDEIGLAIRSVSDAAYRDGKNLGYQPPPDAPREYDGHLHAAIDLLPAAHADLAMPDDDPVARGQHRMALLHVDAALHSAQRAVGAARRADDSRE